MILTIEQLTRILAAGGGLTLDASTFTLNQLRQLAVAAEAGATKSSLTLHNVSGLTAEQFAGLATLAPGQIEFDLTA